PAGVEAWNGIRALDYLQSRPEVDGEKLGVAGRSGGGAYSWWIAALDERIKAAVPTAGITDLENHVVDGCVEGHCDCMFMVNTYRWDYPQVAALVAPRALLIVNTDKDTIFPLDGVARVHRKVREIYRLYGADKQLGLQISEGPHKDIQELQVAEFHWFNRFLKGEDAPVENTGVKYFEPEELKVFESLPADEITSRIHETFVPLAEPPKVPKNKEEWARMRDGWMKALKEKCFAGWPAEPGPLNVERVSSAERNGLALEAYDFDSQEHVRLRLYILCDAPVKDAGAVRLSVGPETIDEAAITTFHENFPDEYQESGLKPPAFGAENAENQRPAHAFFLPRGYGRTQWNADERKQVQIRRRFMLLGQTLAGMQIWDIRRALQALRSIEKYSHAGIRVDGQTDIGMEALYASLFEPPLASISVFVPPQSHLHGFDLLNVLRYVDTPQIVAMAAERQPVWISEIRSGGWDYSVSVGKSLGWGEKNLNIRTFPPEQRKSDSQ
ncbi:MAG TPA: prolyl oligopeptidase family serine peptidase, partial [Pirellulales bacterium]|nr:prolyl oligopeptidase family serine peptidase [Pirellulales bacterium]